MNARILSDRLSARNARSDLSSGAAFGATANPNTIGRFTEPPPKGLPPVDPNYKVEPPWTLDDEAKDTIAYLPSSVSARGTARPSARDSARGSTHASSRASTRIIGTSARPLDSVRTDMSTGRLEVTMASLLAEKSALMKRLNAVEKEIRDDRKKTDPKKNGTVKRH